MEWVGWFLAFRLRLSWLIWPWSRPQSTIVINIRIPPKLFLPSFYVDDGLTGANSIEEAIQLRMRICRNLFKVGGFQLRKWTSNKHDVLSTISLTVEIDTKDYTQELNYEDDYNTKILGIEWNAASDCFRVTISLPEITTPLTKRALVSNTSRLFDTFGWCSPAIITIKIIAATVVGEYNLDWDESVPENIERSWEKWYEELPQLRNHIISRSLFSQGRGGCQVYSYTDFVTTHKWRILGSYIVMVTSTRRELFTQPWLWLRRSYCSPYKTVINSSFGIVRRSHTGEASQPFGTYIGNRVS